MLEQQLKKSKIIKSFIKVDFTKSFDDEKINPKIRDLWREGDKLIDVYTIIYTVDDLSIKGFISFPKNIDTNKKNKTAVFLRGGNNKFGETYSGFLINKNTIFSLTNYLGYITLYTQYRGEASGEGFDAYGGEDIKDVLTLFDIIKELEFCEQENILLMGASRGGLMAYQALTYDIPVEKAVIIAGPTDMERSLTDGWRKGWREYFLQQKFFDITDENELGKRSAVKFYKNIKNIPILVVHGRVDESVNVQDSLDIHRLLPSSKLLIYEDDDHNITTNKNILKEEIIKFLQN